jgi:hypothetical protein
MGRSPCAITALYLNTTLTIACLPSSRSCLLGYLTIQPGHTFRFGDGCDDECYVFIVRDPVKRWISRFLMRKRMLETEYARYSEAPWAELLRMFPAPNDLAEALSDEGNIDRKTTAHKVFLDSEIGAQKRLANWFLEPLHESTGKIRDAYLNSIVAVLTTENLNNDFRALTKTLGLPNRVPEIPLERVNAMPESERGWHGTLSTLGNRNAEIMLQDDYVLLDLLHQRGLLANPCTGTDTCEF